jgi:hypothetical protein
MSLVALVWYVALITNFSFSLVGPEKLGLVYNDMARRLLHLDWTIDPDLISFEAFVYEGRTYTYFGIFPALLRLPAIMAGLGGYTLARISCLLALWMVTFATLRMTQFALGPAFHTLTARRLAGVALLGVSFSGPVIYLLASASIYHEAIFWAAAFTAVFNGIVVRSVITARPLGSKDLALLAFVAGCGLLTRLTPGFALYLGLALIMVLPIATALAEAGWRSAMFEFDKAIRRWPAALVVTMAFAAIQGVVNYGRWGSPFVSVPLQYYQQYLVDPQFHKQFAAYLRHGPIDAVRIPLAAIHYGFGVKVDVLFSGTFAEHFAGVEGPRVAAFLCAPWVMVCAAAGLYWVCSRPNRSTALAPLALANAVGFLMMLAVPWLCLRYTFDGWGFLSLMAALGTGWLVRCADKFDDAVRTRARWFSRTAIVMTIIGVIVSHATLLRYKINYSGTTPAVRYWLSKEIQPHLCPSARLRSNVKLTDFIPLATPSCPPLW